MNNTAKPRSRTRCECTPQGAAALMFRAYKNLEPNNPAGDETVHKMFGQLIPELYRMGGMIVVVEGSAVFSAVEKYARRVVTHNTSGIPVPGAGGHVQPALPMPRPVAAPVNTLPVAAVIPQQPQQTQQNSFMVQAQASTPVPPQRMSGMTQGESGVVVQPPVMGAEGVTDPTGFSDLDYNAML